MIADLNVVKSWIIHDNLNSRILREMMEEGMINVRIPEIVKYEMCKILSDLNLPTEVLRRLVELVMEYLDFFLIKVDGKTFSDAIDIYKSLKNVDFTTAVCVSLAKSLGDVCVTTDHTLATYLRKHGFSVLTVDEVIKIFR